MNREKFCEVYSEERSKLSQLPCADDDFAAHSNAIKRCSNENESNECHNSRKEDYTRNL